MFNKNIVVHLSNNTQLTTKTLFMNIEILSLSSNQNGIEYTWSNNGGDESEIEKMSKEDFAKLLCEHSDGNYIFNEDTVTLKESIQTSEDVYEDAIVDTKFFFDMEIDNRDYCVECLVKYLQSQNKN